MVTLSTTVGSIAAEPPRVLVLHSYHQGFPWTDSVQQGIAAELHDYPGGVELSVEYMDAKRHPDSVLFEDLALIYAAKYQRWRPDLLISCDDDALLFLFEYRSQLFPDIPVVFCGLNVDDYRPDLLAGRSGYTGVVERLDLTSTVELALRLQPQTQRVILVHDRTTTGLADRAALEHLAPLLADRVDFVFPDQGQGLTEGELIKYLSKLDSRSVVYLTGFFRDRLDAPLAPEYIIPRITENTPVPVYIPAEAYFGFGVLGGKLLSGEVHGRSTARQATLVLAGTSADDLPVRVESSNRYMVDYRQLKRHNLDQSRLPPGTIIAFDPTSFIERNRVALFWTLAGALALLAFTLFLLVDRTRRQRLERRLADSEERYRRLVEQSPGIVYVYSVQRGALYWSQRVQDILGYSPDDLKQDPYLWRNAIHPDDAEMVDAAVAGARDGRNFDIEYRIRDLHGKWHWFHDRSQSRRTVGDEVLIEGMATDITDRKDAEARFQRAFSNLEALWSIASLTDADLHTISDHILTSITRMTNSEYGFYGFVNEDESVMTIHAWSGEAMRDCSMAVKPEDFEVCKAGVWAEVIRQRQPLLINDYDIDHQAKHGLPQGHVPIKKLLVVPDISDGHVRAVAAVANRATDYGPDDIRQIEAFLGGIQAVADRRRAEEALRREQVFAQAILDTDPAVVFVKDYQGRFVRVNQACADLFQTTPQALLGVRNSEVLADPAEDDRYGAVDREVIETGVPQVLEELHQRLDGGQTWFLTHKSRITLPNGTPGVLGVCMDLTERNRAEEQLRESRQMLADAEKLAGLGAWTWDIQNDKWELSENWLALHGCTTPPGTTEELLPIAHPDDRPMIREAFEAALAGAGPYDMEHRIIRQDTGEVRIVRALGEVTFDDSGRPLRMAGAAVDITDRTRLEQRRRELEQQVEAARRYESLATMASAIAHNFNNILTTVLGNLHFALQTHGGDDPAREPLESARAAALKAAELSRLMLVYGGFGHERHRPFSLVSLLEEDRTRHRETTPDNINMKYNWPDANRLMVTGDRTGIAEALHKVVDNAIEAIGDATGTITLKLDRRNFSADELADSYIIEKPLPGRFVCLSISDTGPGMSAETRRRLFEPYYTTRFPGRGLGLAAVLGIIRGHNGALFVDSVEGKGTTIHILLPALKEGAGTTDTPAKADDIPIA